MLEELTSLKVAAWRPPIVTEAVVLTPAPAMTQLRVRSMEAGQEKLRPPEEAAGKLSQMVAMPPKTADAGVVVVTGSPGAEKIDVGRTGNGVVVSAGI